MKALPYRSKTQTISKSFRFPQFQQCQLIPQIESQNQSKTKSVSISEVLVSSSALSPQIFFSTKPNSILSPFKNIQPSKWHATKNSFAEEFAFSAERTIQNHHSEYIHFLCLLSLDPSSNVFFRVPLKIRPLSYTSLQFSPSIQPPSKIQTPPKVSKKPTNSA